jgi:PAS domain S-box-containing protein
METSKWLYSQYKELAEFYKNGKLSTEDEALVYVKKFIAAAEADEIIDQGMDYGLTYGQLVGHIVENSFVGIWVTDQHSKTIFRNKRALEILEVNEDDPALYSYHRYIFQPDWQSVNCQDIGNGQKNIAEISFCTGTGENKHLLLSESPLFGHDGQYNGCICLFMEISKRKEAEQSLREISIKYKTISEMTSDFVYSLQISDNNEIICEWVSGSFAKTTGFAPDTITGNHSGYLSLVHPGDKSKYLDAIMRPELSSASRLYRIITAEGKSRWIQDTLTVVHSAEGRKLLGAALDVTEKKSIEDFLQKERDFNALISETIPVGVVVFDKDENVKFINTLCCHILGRTKDKLSGIKGADSSLWGLFSENGEPIPQGKNPLRRVFDERKSISGHRFCIYGTSDSPVFVSVNASPVFQSGHFEGAVATYQDITKEISAERKLSAAKQLAEENDRLKTAFLANISHEIRTPLNGIVGFTDMLQLPDLSLEQKGRYVSIINKSSKQLIQIVNDILDIAKLETGQFVITENKTSLNEILDKAVNYARAELGNNPGKDLSLTAHKGLSDEAGRVFTDAKKLEQVIVKLLNNALKFTHKGEISVGYTLEADSIIFYVSDTGIGIAEDKKEVVFNNFRQGDERSSRDFGGNGLGLSIAKGIVELMGGKIWLETEVNKGTKFSFTIPYNPASHLQEHSAQHDQPDWTGLKILAVDDDIYNMEFIKEAILCTNATLISATDGHTAVQQCLDNTDIRIVLMDIKLPDISGKKVTALIKSLRPELPVVAQTANSQSQDRTSCLQAGCSDFISKPYTRQSLLRVLSKHIK